jgi:hypothetical protein
MHPVSHPPTSSKYLSYLAWFRPMSMSPNLLDYSQQVCTTVDGIVSSNVAVWQPPSPHYHGIMLYFECCLIMASIFALLRLQSAILHTCLIWTLNFAPSLPATALPNLVDHNLRVHLKVHFTIALKCISKYAWLQPPSVSPMSLDHSLTVYLLVHLIVIFRCLLNCFQPPPTSSIDRLCVDM